MPFSSVYRLQLSPNFTLSDATTVVPYLQELGVDAVYASPFFEARPGSTHGYDTTDPTKIREELGGEAGFEDFVKMLEECKMGLVLDLVANHMSASHYNPWWADVLENGIHSKYAHFFDIDWNPPHVDVKGKVYLPILEGPLMRELEAGKIRLSHDSKHIEAGWQRLPVAPGSVSEMPEAYNVAGGKLLVNLLKKQNFRLAFWESGPDGVNDRRFFDINELAALRIEEDAVFDAVHERVFALIREGKVQALRVDHPDGFLHPRQTFAKMRKAGVPHIFVEKILERDETLRDDWNVDGTVGYEFLNELTGLFIKRENEGAFTKVYERELGTSVDPKGMIFEQKKSFALKYMRSEIEALTRRLHNPELFSYDELYEGVVDLIAAFPVYRTYIEERVDEIDASWIEQAFGMLEKTKVHDFLKRWLMLEEGKIDLVHRFQ